MKIFKYLAALVVAIFIMLVFAYLFAIAQRFDCGFYLGLNLPKFAPTKLTMHILMPVNYAVVILVLAPLISRRNFKCEFFLILFVNFLEIAFLFVFFAFKQIYLATILMSVILIISIIVFVLFAMKKKEWAFWSYAVVLNSYLTVVMVFISMNN